MKMAKKILIIEDDANVLYALEAKLSVNGFKTVGIRGGTLEEIINQIKLAQPDYIILDLVLPGLDGQEILLRLKGDSHLKRIPVFIFTDISAAGQKDKSLDSGAEHFFIRQEFSIDDFVAKIGRIIKNKEKVAA